MMYAMWASTLLLMLGAGLYLGLTWDSYWYQPRHSGTYQYSTRKPDEWPHGHHTKREES